MEPLKACVLLITIVFGQVSSKGTIFYLFLKKNESNNGLQSFNIIWPCIDNNCQTLLQEDGMVQVLFTISLLADISLLGATTILVTAPELQEDGMVQVLFTISLLADISLLGATTILVTAPELQEDGMVQVLFTISLLADIPLLGATTILVTSPELQEDGMVLYLSATVHWVYF